MSRALTAKTRIETLKKDAKRWLKALRAGDAKARARLAAAWPKAPAEPTLRDIQQALALEYGQESWATLRAALDDLALGRRTHDERVDMVLRHGWDGDVSIARRILQRHPEVARDSLFAAAACGDLAEVERRLAANPSAATKVGGSRQWTALAYVAYSRLDETNALAIARRLLAAGADPNFAFDDGWGCPFKVVTGAIGRGEGGKSTHPQARDLVELLIEAGADPFDTQSLYNTSIVEDDPFWMDLLWRACEAQGSTDKWLNGVAPGLGARFKQNAVGYLLGNAAGQNHLKRAAWLLDHGADPNAPHAYSGQPVHAVARLAGFSRMAALLERRGARVAPLEGAKAFQAACLCGEEATAGAMAKADPALLKHPDPMLHAAMFGNAGAVRLLLSLGARFDGLDREGISPLHRAVQSGSLETVNLLLAAGGDVNLREKKWNGTPMSWSVVLGQSHIAARLVPLSRDVGALCLLGEAGRLEEVLRDQPQLAREVHRRDDERPTPLFCLPEDDDRAVRVAEILLAHCADPRVKNAKGLTAADAARLRGLDEAAELIENGR
ncbi:MAG: ankyrin repeat domain-containing protein [Alphaproteobacteria bacterium]